MLSVSFLKYGDVCGECDGVEVAKRRQRDVCGIAEEERDTFGGGEDAHFFFFFPLASDSQ